MTAENKKQKDLSIFVKNIKSIADRLSGQAIFGYLLVMIAAAFWATLGIFYKTLISVHQLSPLAVVFWRALIASIALFLYLGFRQKGELRLMKRDFLFFLAFGMIGVAAFFVVYIHAISYAGIGVAAVLMYTAPVWVTLFSVLFMGESFDGRKGAALFLAVLGSGLVGRFYDLEGVRLNLTGILAGIGAGVGYGSYILYSKSAARKKYNPWTTLAYALGIGALFLLPMQSPAELSRVVASPPILIWLLGIGLLPTLGGGLAFNTALHNIPASNASIIATLEPVIASILGWAIFAEQFDSYQLIGGGLIILAVVVLQLYQPKAG
jgi:drug/metabolite transporter (DMT)-like permease